MKPNCLTPKSCHACAWRSVQQNKIETRLNRKRAIGIKLASRHIPSRSDKIGDKEKVADDLPLMSASCAKGSGPLPGAASRTNWLEDGGTGQGTNDIAVKLFRWTILRHPGNRRDAQQPRGLPGKRWPHRNAHPHTW